MKNRTTVILISAMALLLIFNIVTFSALMVLRSDLRERMVISSGAEWGYYGASIDKRFTDTDSKISSNSQWIREVSNRLYDVTDYLEIKKGFVKRDLTQKDK